MSKETEVWKKNVWGWFETGRGGGGGDCKWASSAYTYQSATASPRINPLSLGLRLGLGFGFGFGPATTIDNNDRSTPSDIGKGCNSIPQPTRLEYALEKATREVQQQLMLYRNA